MKINFINSLHYIGFENGFQKVYREKLYNNTCIVIGKNHRWLGSKISLRRMKYVMHEIDFTFTKWFYKKEWINNDISGR